MADDTPERMRRRLAALHPVELQIDDDSHLHVGHAGAAGGAGHYRLRLVSPDFAGVSRLQRHRLVYDCLDYLIPGEIHALAMTLLSPAEAADLHPPSESKS